MMDATLPGPKHGAFVARYGQGRRLDYGLDFIKAMPEQRWAHMVQLYDDLLDRRES